MKSHSNAVANAPLRLSNIATYLAIAEDAFSESKRLYAAGRKPKPNGEPGFVIMFDPDSKCFKQSLIALVFAGVYLEALMYLAGTERLGNAGYMKIDRNTYEEKLAALGINDQNLLATCKRVREARNDLVHEKAVEAESIGSAVLRKAQKEAEVAIGFIRSVPLALQNAP